MKVLHPWIHMWIQFVSSGLSTYLFIHLCILWEVLVGPTILYIILNIAVCTCQSQIPSLSIPPSLLLVLDEKFGEKISRK